MLGVHATLEPAFPVILLCGRRSGISRESAKRSIDLNFFQSWKTFLVKAFAKAKWPGHTFQIPHSLKECRLPCKAPVQQEARHTIVRSSRWNLANEDMIARGGCLQRMKSTMQLHRIVEAFLTQVCNSVLDFLWCCFVLRPTLQEMAEASPQNTGLLGESYCYACGCNPTCNGVVSATWGSDDPSEQEEGDAQPHSPSLGLTLGDERFDFNQVGEAQSSCSHVDFITSS